MTWPRLRLLVLFLRQRVLVASLVASSVAIGLHFWVSGWIADWAHPERMDIFVVVGPLAVAVITGIAIWSPSADLEATSSLSLRWARLLHVAIVCGLGIVGTSIVLVADLNAVYHGDSNYLMLWIRNTCLLTGLALLQGRFFNPRLSWLLPSAVVIVAGFQMMGAIDDPLTSVNERFTQPFWNVIAHSDTSIEAGAIGFAMLVIGVIVLAARGPALPTPGEA
ncbi:MAG: hypothetical protein WKF81_12845 [Thermomicrobiales bacterium]